MKRWQVLSIQQPEQTANCSVTDVDVQFKNRRKPSSGMLKFVYNGIPFQYFKCIYINIFMYIYVYIYIYILPINIAGNNFLKDF
jgi:hypothetical protein